MTCAATLSQINQVKCFSTVCLIQLEMIETVVFDSMSLHSTGYEEEDYRESTMCTGCCSYNTQQVKESSGHFVIDISSREKTHSEREHDRTKHFTFSHFR